MFKKPCAKAVPEVHGDEVWNSWAWNYVWWIFGGKISPVIFCPNKQSLKIRHQNFTTFRWFFTISKEVCHLALVLGVPSHYKANLLNGPFATSQHPSMYKHRQPHMPDAPPFGCFLGLRMWGNTGREGKQRTRRGKIKMKRDGKRVSMSNFSAAIKSNFVLNTGGTGL